MKKFLILILLVSFGSLTAQDMEGAWKLTHVNDEPVTDEETVKIYQDDYFSYGTKEAGTNKFIKAGGGEFSTANGYSETYDFDTEDAGMVGQSNTYELEHNEDRLSLTDEAGSTEIWERISANENDLSGNWVITGRQRNGELSRNTPGARRTIKILGGDRFQWVAFNSDTGEFFGSGGGTYSAENGNYTENIEFFSRDDSRVGASLGFDYEIKNGEWHHSGQSSKGEPMYEIWSPYKEAYQK